MASYLSHIACLNTAPPLAANLSPYRFFGADGAVGDEAQEALTVRILRTTIRERRYEVRADASSPRLA
jgi:hypothetical protein